MLIPALPGTKLDLTKSQLNTPLGRFVQRAFDTKAESWELEPILDVLDAYGLPYKDVASPFGWNGRRIALKNSRPHGYLHELAHWRLAPPRRRKLPEFGLGSGFTTMTARGDNIADKFMKVSNKRAQYEEELTCVLGWCHVLAIGRNVFEIMNEESFLDWVGYTRENVIRFGHRNDNISFLSTCNRFNTLIREGFIDESGIPTMKIR